MSIDEKGLAYVKPLTFSVVPDAHACSFNRLKTIRIDHESGTVFLTEFEIQELISFVQTIHRQTGKASRK